MLPVAVTWSFSYGIAVCYVLPVLWMVSCLHTVEPVGGRMGWRCVLVCWLPQAERRLLWVGWPASSQAVLLPRRPQTRDVARVMALQSTVS